LQLCNQQQADTSARARNNEQLKPRECTVEGAVLPTLRFSLEFGLGFCGVVPVFSKTCGLLGFGLSFNSNLLGFWTCFFADSFFLILWHFCCFNMLLKAYWTCFCENLLILGLFFRIYHPDFLFDFLADFWFCRSFLPMHLGLFFG